MGKSILSVNGAKTSQGRFTRAELERISKGIDGRIVYRIVKRLFDIAFSLVVLACLLPLHLLMALSIWIDNPHASPLFYQERVGRHGKVFKMVKFRSMYADAEERLEELMDANEKDGPVFKIKDDSRITRVGKLIRKTSLAPAIIGTPGDGEPTESPLRSVYFLFSMQLYEYHPVIASADKSSYELSRCLPLDITGNISTFFVNYHGLSFFCLVGRRPKSSSPRMQFLFSCLGIKEAG